MNDIPNERRVPRPVTLCCCAACGNCTRAPIHDDRMPCCCGVCGHCFRPPVVTQTSQSPLYWAPGVRNMQPIPPTPRPYRHFYETSTTAAASLGASLQRCQPEP